MELEKEFNKIKNKISNLGKRVDEYTELSEKMKKVELHLQIAGELISQGKKRKLNEYFEL